MPSRPSENGSDRTTSAALGRAAVATVTTLLIYGTATFFFFPAGGQFTKYPHAAALYSSGQLASERLLDFSPFYFYLLAAQQELLPGAGSLVGGLQLLAIALAAGLLLLLLERFFPIWIAAAGTGAFVLSRGPLLHAPVLEPEAFLLLFLVAFLHFSLSPKPSAQWAAGVTLALCIAIRPSALPLLAVVPVFCRINDPASWQRPLKRMLLPPLVLLAGLSARNATVSGSYSPLGMNPGFVFFEGNNPLSSGKSSVYPPLVEALRSDLSDQPDNPHVAYRLLADRSTGRELSTAEVNRYWRAKALRFVADHPMRYLRLLATKAYATWHGYRWHDVPAAQRFDQRLAAGRIPAFPFALLAALALCGLATPPREPRRAMMIYVLLASQVGVMLALYVSERQRLALLPGLVFLACGSLAYLASASNNRRILFIAGVTLLAAVFSLPNHHTREDRHLWAAYDSSERAWMEAVRLQQTGRSEEAAQTAALSVAHAPWLEDFSRPAGLSFAPEGFAARALSVAGPAGRSASLDLDRAQLLIGAGRLAEADSLLRSLIQQDERYDRGQIQSSDPRFFLGRSLARSGRQTEALDVLQGALSSNPGDPFVLAELAALTGDDAYTQRIARYFSEVDALFLTGLAKLEHGRPAVAELERTVQLVPELWRARIYHAAAVGAAGNPREAARLYLDANDRRQGPPMLEERIVPLFAAAVALAPDDASLHFARGLMLERFGRFDEALAALRAALTLEARPEFQSAIARVERSKASGG